MWNIGIKKFIRTSVLLIVAMAAIMVLFSCKSFLVKSAEEETLYVPEAANQFALDKETEVETVEATKAHHIYPEGFKLAPSAEITIGEKDFLTRINYIYNHVDDFKDTDIIVEGMYGWYTSWDKTFEFPMVYRNGPSCCGDDQYGGFYLVNIDQTQYEIDDWIVVKGKPFMYEHKDSEGENQYFLFLLVTEINKLTTKERKAEMVNN